MSLRYGFKFVHTRMWHFQLKKAGQFFGTIEDRRDGFIHLSPASEVQETYDRKFMGKPGLLLVKVDLSVLEDDGIKVCVEKARNGKFYPHVYGVIIPSSVPWILDVDTDTTDMNSEYSNQC